MVVPGNDPDGRVRDQVGGVTLVAILAVVLPIVAVALVIITPLMMLLLGSLRRGFVSMIPNLMPVVAVLGVMGWLGIPVNIMTSIVPAPRVSPAPWAIEETVFMLAGTTTMPCTGWEPLAMAAPRSSSAHTGAG